MRRPTPQARLATAGNQIRVHPDRPVDRADAITVIEVHSVATEVCWPQVIPTTLLANELRKRLYCLCAVTEIRSCDQFPFGFLRLSGQIAVAEIPQGGSVTQGSNPWLPSSVQVGSLVVIILQSGHRVGPDTEEVDFATNSLAPLAVGMWRERESGVWFGRPPCLLWGVGHDRRQPQETTG